MNPATGAIITGTTVMLGQWAKDEPVTIRVVVGGTVLALGLSVMNEYNAELAGKFATLVVVAAVFMYLPAILWKLGILDHKTWKTAPKW